MKSFSGCVQLSLFEAAASEDCFAQANGLSSSSVAVWLVSSDDFPEEIKAAAYRLVALQLLSCLASSLECEPLSGGHHVC